MKIEDIGRQKCCFGILFFFLWRCFFDIFLTALLMVYFLLCIFDIIFLHYFNIYVMLLFTLSFDDIFTSVLTHSHSQIWIEVPSTYLVLPGNKDRYVHFYIHRKLQWSCHIKRWGNLIINRKAVLALNLNKKEFYLWKHSIKH